MLSSTAATTHLWLWTLELHYSKLHTRFQRLSIKNKNIKYLLDHFYISYTLKCQYLDIFSYKMLLKFILPAFYLLMWLLENLELFMCQAFMAHVIFIVDTLLCGKYLQVSVLFCSQDRPWRLCILHILFVFFFF